MITKEHPISKNRARQIEEFWRAWTRENAYAAGCFLADGCIWRRSLSFEVQERDREWAEALGNLMKEGIHITERGLNGRKYVRWTFTGVGLAECLERFGVRPNKSGNDYPWPRIPDEFLGDYLRGFLDGDGYINEEGDVTWLGTFNVIKGLIENCNRVLGTRNADPYHMENRLFRICYSSRHDKEVLFRSLYGRGGLRLVRKEERLRKALGAK